MNSQELENKIKMYLFCRWMATCYADEHMDGDGNDQHGKQFNPKDAMSVLNRETGHWYVKQMEYFENTVYPNYIKNGSVANAENFLFKKHQEDNEKKYFITFQLFLASCGEVLEADNLTKAEAQKMREELDACNGDRNYSWYKVYDKTVNEELYKKVLAKKISKEKENNQDYNFETGV